MKLLYLLTEPFGVGGVQSDMLALSEDLVKRNHVVYVASTPGVMLDELKSRGGIFVNLNFHFRGILSLIQVGLKLRKFIIENKIDVLAPQSVRSTIVSFLFLRLMPFSYRVKSTAKKIPIITTIHNIHSPVHFKYGGFILNRCSDYVIFESNYERDRLIASGLNSYKSKVIHSGIDTDIFEPQKADDRLLKEYNLDKKIHTIYGIVARLSEEKGHDHLLRAFLIVLQKNPMSRLLIVGDGPLLDETIKLAKELKVFEFVVFTGLKRNVSEHLALFDAFVLSSTRESFPLAAREAMAAGKAVIAPRIGGCPEVVDDGETGFLFEVANSNELAQRMIDITTNNLYVEFGVKSRKRVVDLFSRHQWIDGDEAVYLKYFS